MTKTLFQRIFPYLLVLPTFAFVVMFTLYPVTRTVLDSTLQPARRASELPTFVWLDNYADLFNEAHYLGARFIQVLGNTLTFTTFTVVFGVPLAFLFALLLNRQIRGLGFLRFSIFYPSLLPLIGAASIWTFFYSDTIGLFNTVLRALGLTGVNWLGDPNTVLYAILIMNLWKQSSYYMIFYLAALQNIPRDIYEAAELDGAGWLYQLTYITIPLLRRTTLFISVVAMTFTFQTVEQLQVMNQGNPADRGNLLLYFIFQNIGERRNWGYINAMSVILVLILLVLTVMNFVFLERRDDDKA
jgi:sn-glycerol 3-phosphate transport system permease protein